MKFNDFRERLYELGSRILLDINGKPYGIDSVNHKCHDMRFYDELVDVNSVDDDIFRKIIINMHKT